MARTEPSSPRVQRLTSLAATLLVAAATAFAFGRVYEGRGSTAQLVAVAIASGVLAWASERRGLLAATGASAGALVLALGLIVFRETTWVGVPTLETFRQMGEAASAVSEQARIQTAPTPPIDPLMLAGVVAMWASVFSCHALAFRAGSPLLALVPPVALLAFADTVLEEVVRPMYGVAFLIGAFGVVFADSLRRTQSWGPVWNGRPGRGGTGVIGASGRGARRLAAAALAVAALAPIAVPGFGTSGLIDVSSWNDGDRLLVDPLVSIASELTRDDPVDVLTVTTQTPSYLRMLTLPDFDGITWRRGEEPSGELVTETLQPPRAEQQFGQSIAVTTDLGFPWIPMAAEPTWINLEGELLWDEEHGTITVGEPLDAGTTYSTRSDLLQPGPADLRAIPAGVDGDPARYLDLPSDLPPEIERTARAWTVDLGSDYERVIAIQEQLRLFTYSTDVELRDDSSTLVEFLEVTQTGFCQQFASAMAVMLRSIGVPARVAVGFTEGEEDPERPDSYTISTDNLHSWVEVPFGTYGWLSFEPTPIRENPVAVSYQQPEAEDACRGAECPRRGPGQQAGIDGPTPAIDEVPRQALPVPAAGGDGGGAGGDGDLRRMLIWLAAGLVLLAAAAVPLARSLLRRRRLRRARGEPRRSVLATYDVLSERAADLGAGRGPGETPFEYLHRLDASDRLADGHLARLTAVTTRAAYAAEPPTHEDALDAEADAREILRALRRTTPPLRRLAGAYRPGA